MVADFWLAIRLAIVSRVVDLSSKICGGISLICQKERRKKDMVVGLSNKICGDIFKFQKRKKTDIRWDIFVRGFLTQVQYIGITTNAQNFRFLRKNGEKVGCVEGGGEGEFVGLRIPRFSVLLKTDDNRTALSESPPISEIDFFELSAPPIESPKISVRICHSVESSFSLLNSSSLLFTAAL